ncbi:hypothetical protein X275_06860 [Marinitoga sp. 1197]|nr:hypothetical protein X275_06860 [Marinitoga sp. 1197]
MKAFAKDFGFKIKLCKPRHSYTKGKVESANKFISWILAYDKDFEDEKELNEMCSNNLKKLDNFL